MIQRVLIKSAHLLGVAEARVVADVGFFTFDLGAAVKILEYTARISWCC